MSISSAIPTRASNTSWVDWGKATDSTIARGPAVAASTVSSVMRADAS